MAQESQKEGVFQPVADNCADFGCAIGGKTKIASNSALCPFGKAVNWRPI
jgi:hypothetical protein